MNRNINILLITFAIQISAFVQAEPAQLVTSSASGSNSVSAGGNSFGPVFSADGKRIAFVSHAGNLVTNETLRESLQVFVRDLATSNTVLVSVSTNGKGGNGDSFGPMISSNAQFVVFTSEASDLVNGDTNGASDVFVRDLSSGTTTLVSLENYATGSAAGSAFPYSANALISADGRWVFFESRSTNFGVPDFNNGTDVFARDWQSNEWRLISTAMSGAQTADGISTLAAISDNGQYAAFISTATNVAAGGINPAGDLYRRDIGSADVRCASKNVSSLVPLPYRCVSAILSANGRYAAFATVGASNGVFRHDFESDVTTLIELRDGEVNGPPRLSDDGRYVTFGDGTNVFRFDASNGTKELVNATTNASAPASGAARNPVATPDGNGIVFISDCPDLVTNSSTLFQIHARDMAAGTTRLITVATNEQPSATNNEVSLLAVTPDFSRVAFDSTASDLVQGDGNRASDVFVRELAEETTTLISVRGRSLPRASGVAHAFISRDCVSADGRFIAFTSYDGDLLPNDSNVRPDVFVRDLTTGTVVTPSISTNAARSPTIDANGRYVAYLRRSPAFVFETIGGDAFRFDRALGTNELVSHASSSIAPAISSNGNFIAFLDQGNLFLRDMTQTTNFLIGPALKSRDRDALFTADGRFLLFVRASPSYALYAWDTFLQQTQSVTRGSGATAIALSSGSRFVAICDPFSLFMVDLIARTNQVLRSATMSRPLVAVNGDGTLVVYSDDGRRLLELDRTTGEETVVAEPGELINTLAVSADGRFVVYARRTFGANGPEDNVFTWQLFVRDRTLGTTTLITLGADGANANGPISQPVMAADGRTVVFHSVASDLVPGDYNDKSDVFVLKLGGVDSDGDGMDDDWEVAYFGNLLRDGSGDFDGDGQTDLQEFLAGTDPTNSDSIFRVMTVTPLGGGSTRVIWTGNPTRSYRVEYRDELSATFWSALNGTISWVDSTGSITDPGASTNRYYRVVRLP